jgi:hypothetical protein
VTQRFGRALIEEYAHLCWSKGTSRSMIEYGPHLIKRNARKPFDKLGYQCSVLDILKQRRYGHAATTKYPNSTDSLGVSLDCRAGRPVNHDENGSTLS